MAKVDSRVKARLLDEGAYHMMRKEWDSAIRCFDRILEDDPKHAGALSNKGAVLFEKGKIIDALNLFTASLDENPRNCESWMNKGLCFHSLNTSRARDTDFCSSALQCCDKALELDRFYDLAWVNKCIILFDSGSYEEALEVASEALETGIVTSKIFLLKAKSLALLGRLSAVLLNVNSGLFLNRDDEELHKVRKWCLNAIAHLRDSWREGELVDKDNIDERYLPSLNHVFQGKPKGQPIDLNNISAERIMSMEGLDTSDIRIPIPAERLSRISRLTNVSEIQEVIEPQTKLLLLCGSGVSVDSPSNLPTGKQFLDALIRAIVPPSLARDQVLSETVCEVGLGLPALGFESFLQVVQEFGDSSLRVLDIFSLSKVPNRNHYFLAKMIKHGHIVVTTNFDNLIEEAFRRLFPTQKLEVLITNEDFGRFVQNPEKFEHALFKLHGSLVDVSGRDIRDTIKATLLQVGRGGMMFGDESYKREAFQILLRKHPLVVLGYSGFDEIDVVSTLVKTKSLQKVIWVDHKSSSSPSEQELETCELILATIEDDKSNVSATSQSRCSLYRGPTSLAIDEISRCKIPMSAIEECEATPSHLDHAFEADIPRYFRDWRDRFINRSWQLPSFLGGLYKLVGKVEEAEFYFEDALRLLPWKARNTILEAILNNNLGTIPGLGHKEKEAYLKKSLSIFEHSEDFYNAATVSANLAVSCAQYGEHDESEKLAKTALEWFSKTEEDPLTMGQLLTLLGALAIRKREFEQSLTYLEKAIEYREKTGDLRGLLVTYSHLVHVYNLKGDKTKFKYYLTKEADLSKVIQRRDVLIEFKLGHRVEEDSFQTGSEAPGNS